MITRDHSAEVRRPVRHVFDVIGRHYVENHPRWEDEVLEIRPVSEGPMREGFRSVMVRRDGRRTHEVPTVCTGYVEDRLLAFAHTAGPLDFRIRFELVPLDDARTRVTAHVEMQPKGALRLMAPLLRARGQAVGDRITARMARLVEETPSYQQT